MLTLRCAGPSVVTSFAADEDLARVGDSSPAIMRSVVVLPQPEGRGWW